MIERPSSARFIAPLHSAVAALQLTCSQSIQGRQNVWGRGGLVPHQFVKESLTLFQSRWANYAHQLGLYLDFCLYSGAPESVNLLQCLQMCKVM